VEASAAMSWMPCPSAPSVPLVPLVPFVPCSEAIQSASEPTKPCSNAIWNALLPAVPSAPANSFQAVPFHFQVVWLTV
jgi:hypothetical protein